MPSSLETNRKPTTRRQPLAEGPWPIGDVLCDLLEQFDIDLTEPAHYVVDAGSLDDVFAFC